MDISLISMFALFIVLALVIAATDNWHKKEIEKAVMIEDAKWIAGCINALTDLDKGRMWLDGGLIDEYPRLNNKYMPYYYLKDSNYSDHFLVPNVSSDCAHWQTSIISRFAEIGKKFNKSVNLSSEKNYPSGAKEKLLINVLMGL